MERASEDVGYEDRKVVGQGYDQPGYASAAYQAYCNRVCSVLKKATKKEKSSLSEELLDHMESHAEALVELGWDPQEARDYAVEAMGDPETVGRQYDEKLSSFWLWCGRVLRVLCILLAVLMLEQITGNWLGLRSHFEARWDPYNHGPESSVHGNVLRCDRVDIPVPTPSGKQVIRVYQTQLVSDWTGENYKVIVSVVGYPKNPLGTKSDLLSYMTMDGYHGSSASAPGYAYHRLSAEVEKGQESVELVIYREATGTDIRVEIPLYWEDIP